MPKFLKLLHTAALELVMMVLFSASVVCWVFYEIWGIPAAAIWGLASVIFIAKWIHYEATCPNRA
ncbi:hypothetical protein [Pelagibaculum spongiae]|uniref:Uncharacterized protein n=1 Tax=Pelagibaculum spongiae TaxID=2080658 RepID=A0A2V1H2K7_9GAMM|nr:hypothetical protein [Pelagibaculum spongiae]PVZ70631.1 hypothetical protein DC094_08625 [Pelagibaculum spongiae]